MRRRIARRRELAQKQDIVDPGESVDIGAVQAKLRRIFHKAEADGISVSDAFEAFDKDGDGTIDRAEFAQALADLPPAKPADRSKTRRTGNALNTITYRPPPPPPWGRGRSPLEESAPARLLQTMSTLDTTVRCKLHFCGLRRRA